MSEIVNLRQARKQRARNARRAKADANAAMHGRTSSQREAEDAQAQKLREHLDAHRLGSDDKA